MEAFQVHRSQTKIYKDIVFKMQAKDANPFEVYYNLEKFDDYLFYDSSEDEYNYQTKYFLVTMNTYYDTYQHLIPSDMKNKCHSNVKSRRWFVENHRANKPSVHMETTY
jgi:hypothetical protein